ncbi:PREDICTED: polyamine-modulated factor 1-binding protein 1-like isoform X3 [Brassica oleracea var. oleracea]|uniref:polyamine-modulated factor 1-binding protein 1-like isoform X3 n=1 Tax=Brassica oleracea var. oleracea TaxID=109376 RepID=UPI0006A732A6|nr:PREDICTED: polyamine-modulated factor 1-binding protein 1-like isoform X3 [Brassica oleracea var. oleracea]
MSWLRSAVHKAVEVGGTGKNNLTRTVRNYADSVVLTAGNAVSEGAKLIHDRIGTRNVKSFSLEVKRLEEVSVSSRGDERVQLLRRWLVSLREVERMSLDQIQPSSEEAKDFTAVCYVDPGLPGEAMTFRDVFLHSEALEGMVLSMILEAPNEEEVQMLVELFGLSLSGEKEVHEEVIQNVQDLAAVFSKYKDEVLAKREELLHYVQDAIGGLKISADLARIDTEAQALKEKLDKTKVKVLEKTSNEDSSKPSGTSAASTEVRTFSKLEALLLKKKSLRNGDSPQHHSEKVDKLKVLSESLLNSTSKEEKRIVDHSRSQKEEALSYRLSKTDEVSQREKDVAAELKKLEIMKEDLEAELKRVNTSITSARARLHNAREEREQFDNASNEILMHLKSKEDELTRSIGSCRVEADVVNKWIKFLEDTWIIQSKFAQQKEIQVSGEMERYGDHFIDLIVQLLSFYKEQLDPSIPKVRRVVELLEPSKGLEAEVKTDDKDAKPIDSRKQLEKEYLDLEAKFVTTLSVVDAMKKPFYSQTEGISRKDDKRVKELFEALNKTKEEFESIERPLLDIESPSRTSSSSSRSPSLKMIPEVPLSFTVQKEFDGVETPDSKKGSSEKKDPAKKQLELELDDGEESLADEINDWEFDALDDTHIKNQ